MTKTKILISLTLLIIIFSSCSVVFTSSLTGSVLDAETYEDDPDGVNGISQVFVYCYTDSSDRDADFDAWADGSGALPDDGSNEEIKFFSSTVSDNEGEWEFNGIIWEEIFPEYGKSGDRFELFMLFYHPDYGLQKNPSSLFIVSDVTNRLAPVMIEDLYNNRRVTGSVIDNDSGEDLQGISVSIYVPDSWAYDTDGNIINLDFPSTPTYSTTTDDKGDWEQYVKFLMMPGRADNQGNVQVLITFSSDDYKADPSYDSNLVNDEDIDKDGDIDDDDVYYLTTVIEKEDEDGSSLAHSLSEVALIPWESEHSATVKGSIVDHNGDGEPNATVILYVPRGYSSGATVPTLSSGFSVQDKAADGYYIYDRDRTGTDVYQLTTDEDGFYEQEFTFAFFPDEDNDLGVVEVLIYIEKDDFSDPSVDGVNIKDDVDLDGDEIDDVYYHPDEINKDSFVYLSDVAIKQTKFSEELDGLVLDNTGAGVNNQVVWIFDFVSASLVAGEEPYDRVTSASKQVNNSGTGDYEAGHFSFTAIGWTDSAYTSVHSSSDCTIYVPTSAEISAGTTLGAPDGQIEPYSLSSSSDNFITVDLP